MVYRAFYNFTGAFKGQEIDYPIEFTNVNDPSVKECRILNLNAKTFNKKYGNSETIQPNSYRVHYLIRYCPNIEGYQNFAVNAIYGGQSGCFTDLTINETTDSACDLLYNIEPRYRALQFDARGSSNFYGNSDTVQPNSVRITFIIRYEK